MRDITLSNFRCYEEKQMAFRRGINLLIGDNSVGKTSLLRACNLVINSFFSGYSDEFTKWKSAEDDDFRILSSDDVISSEDLPIRLSFHLDEHDLPLIQLVNGNTYFFDYAKEQYIEKRSRKNSRNLISGLTELKNYAKALQSNAVIIENAGARQLNALPVYAYYTTEDIHSARKFDKEKRVFKRYPQKPSFGYFESFDAKGLLDCWIKRLLVLREAKKGDCEIENVRRAIQTALGKNGCNIINDIDIRPNDGEVIFMLSDGREVKTELLSDGYRRLVSIVIDMAMRSALLNKSIFSEEAYHLSHGTVIIDEIDEHLHPAIQLRILKALHRTFPNIQFIVSTHSPLVISSVEAAPENVVYKLDYDSNSREYTHTELNAYGLDASTIVSVYMDGSARDLDIANELKSIEDLIDNNNLQEARTALRSLEDRLCTNDPEFAHLESMISFLE